MKYNSEGVGPLLPVEDAVSEQTINNIFEISYGNYTSETLIDELNSHIRQISTTEDYYERGTKFIFDNKTSKIRLDVGEGDVILISSYLASILKIDNASDVETIGSNVRQYKGHPLEGDVMEKYQIQIL